jgi:hypothetical protein
VVRAQGETVMASIEQYDEQLQMYRLEPREPSMEKLQFLRWLIERGKLEHGPAGPSTGEYQWPHDSGGSWSVEAVCASDGTVWSIG